jgi:6-phospho 3-hexuloisomerase
MTTDKHEKIFVSTMLEIAKEIKKNSEIIDIKQISELIDLILKIHKKSNLIFIYGAGRSGFIGRCFAQRLMHLGIRSCFISDAITYRYTNDDLLILISGSGETISPVAIAQNAKKIGGKIVLITGNIESRIAKMSDLVIRVEGKSKDMATNKITLAPYTSLFDISVLSMLDSLAGIVMNLLGITERDIDKRHATLE